MSRIEPSDTNGTSGADAETALAAVGLAPEVLVVPAVVDALTVEGLASGPGERSNPAVTPTRAATPTIRRTSVGNCRRLIVLS
jgi:hypothetical protein